MKTKDARLRRAGVSGYNKPKRTPGHSKKSRVHQKKVNLKNQRIEESLLKLGMVKI